MRPRLHWRQPARYSLLRRPDHCLCVTAAVVTVTASPLRRRRRICESRSGRPRFGRRDHVWGALREPCQARSDDLLETKQPIDAPLVVALQGLLRIFDAAGRTGARGGGPGQARFPSSGSKSSSSPKAATRAGLSVWSCSNALGLRSPSRPSPPRRRGRLSSPHRARLKASCLHGTSHRSDYGGLLSQVERGASSDYHRVSPAEPDAHAVL